MARLTPEQWELVKQDRISTGASFRVLSEKHGVSDVAILKKAKAEGWDSDPANKPKPKAGNDLGGEVSTEVSELANQQVSANHANPANQKRRRARSVAGDAVPEKDRGGNPRRAEPKPLSSRPPTIRNFTPEKLEIGPPTDEQITKALETMSPKEIAFLEAYLECFNGTRAWMQVYGVTKENTAAKAASDKLRTSKVRAYLANRMSAAFADSEGAKARLINTLQSVAYGDVTELVEYRRDACRYCYGENHLYQFTPAEYANKQKQAEDDGKEFDEAGGIGFDPRKEPHPECPECHGEGKGRVMFKASANLSPAGLAMFAGAKVGKDGIEIKMNSQEKARDALARTLKLYEDDKSIVTINLDSATLEERFVSRMRAAHERQLKVLQERGIVQAEE